MKKGMTSLVEHFIDMPDGTQLLIVTDNHQAYPPKMLSYMQAIWVNHRLEELGVPQRVRLENA